MLNAIILQFYHILIIFPDDLSEFVILCLLSEMYLVAFYCC